MRHKTSFGTGHMVDHHLHATHGEARRCRPTPEQREWLARGVDQPGGKLPLFDRFGQSVNARTIRACIDQGWAAPWFTNPLKPDWLVCKLTETGRTAVLGEAVSATGNRRPADHPPRP